MFKISATSGSGSGRVEAGAAHRPGQRDPRSRGRCHLRHRRWVAAAARLQWCRRGPGRCGRRAPACPGVHQADREVQGGLHRRWRPAQPRAARAATRVLAAVGSLPLHTARGGHLVPPVPHPGRFDGNGSGRLTHRGRRHRRPAGWLLAYPTGDRRPRPVPGIESDSGQGWHGLVALAEPLRRTARPDRDYWHYARIRAAASVERWSSSPGFAREPRRSGAGREQTRNRTCSKGDSGPPRVIARYLVPPWCAAFPTPEPPRAVIGAAGFSHRIPARSGR